MPIPDGSTMRSDLRTPGWLPVRPRAVVPMLLALAALIPSPSASAQTVVKLATLVPDGSVWHEILLDQMQRWESSSDGAVEVRIYPGGVAGDDPAVVRKMRVGQFQVAALSVEGLVDIDDAFRVFQIPMFYESPDEAFHVLEALTPVLRNRLEAKGFVLLNWGYGGWVHLYSKGPIRTVEELRSQKMFLWGGDERSMRISRDVGLQPVGLPATDIMMGLQTGMIDAMATTPLAALAFQWFRLAGYQLDPGVSPLIGGTVMTQRAWDGLPEKARAAVRATADPTYQRIRTEVEKAEREAVEVMKARGLTVTTVPIDDPAWRAVVDGIADGSRNELVPPDVYDLALRARNAYRAGQRREPVGSR